MIEFDNVCKRYSNGHDALQHVSFMINKGEMTFLTGHSGAGKSTLLKLITVIEKPTSGRVIVNGHQISQLSSWRIPQLRRSIGVIFQNPNLLEEYTVFDNVALPLVIAGYRHQEIGRRVRAALDKVNLLNKEKYYPAALSGGEQQRVGIARAVVHKPAILLADEPTGNLDPQLSAEIMFLFEQFNQVGVNILIASHDLALIGKLQHRIMTLHQGCMVSTGVRIESKHDTQHKVETEHG
ncbi:MAG: cell division ATP-binding protein FtsE [Gammaproteobacteria bacterium]